MFGRVARIRKIRCIVYFAKMCKLVAV